MVATLMSVAVIASFLLFGAGAWMIVGGKDRRKGVLMIVAAAVLTGNVLVWAL